MRLCCVVFAAPKKTGGNEGNHWQRPASEVSDRTHSPPTKGHFTLSSAGVLLILSAILEGLSMTSAVPLSGELRGDAAAIGYQMLFMVVFLLMGIGLWSAKWWGYRAVLLGTGVYVLDRVTYLISLMMRPDQPQSRPRPSPINNYSTP
jgi:hypothetical protein